jgi:hypothetical protein
MAPCPAAILPAHRSLSSCCSHRSVPLSPPDRYRFAVVLPLRQDHATPATGWRPSAAIEPTAATRSSSSQWVKPSRSRACALPASARPARRSWPTARFGRMSPRFHPHWLDQDLFMSHLLSRQAAANRYAMYGPTSDSQRAAGRSAGSSVGAASGPWTRFSIWRCRALRCSSP